MFDIGILYLWRKVLAGAGKNSSPPLCFFVNE